MNNGIRCFALLKTRCYECNLHLVTQCLVVTHTKNHIGINSASLARHIIRHFTHLIHCNLVIRSIREIKQHMLGTRDVVVVQQHRGCSLFYCLACTVLPFSFSNSHKCRAAVLHHSINISEINIHVCIQCDNLSNAFHSGQQHIVGH